jgi:hypothetical protein
MLFPFSFIQSQGVTYDPDAAAFFARVTEAGGSLTTLEKNATNQLVLDLKANSLWTPMKAIYPMVGASAAACAQNLKSSSFTGAFTSTGSTGWTFSSSGAKPDGTSAYMNTTFNAFISSNGVNDFSVSVYLRTATQGGASQADLGASSTVNSLPQIALYSNNTFRENDCWDYQTNFSRTTTNDSRGMWGVSRSGVSNWISFDRNTPTNKTTTNTYSTLPNANIYLGAYNYSYGGYATLFSPREIAFSHMGDNLTFTQWNNFYTSVQTFQTTLGRQV